MCTNILEKAWCAASAPRGARTIFGIGGELDGSRQASLLVSVTRLYLRIVFRRHDDIEAGDQRSIVAHELGTVLGEHHVVAIGTLAARLRWVADHTAPVSTSRRKT